MVIGVKDLRFKDLIAELIDARLQAEAPNADLDGPTPSQDAIDKSNRNWEYIAELLKEIDRRWTQLGGEQPD